MEVRKDGVIYELHDDGTADVTGYYGAVSRATIPGKIENHRVVRILKDAFQNCWTLCEVTVSPGVTEIGKDAFNECRNLKVITLPGTVTSIAEHCFWAYDKTTFILAPEGSEVQRYCESRKSLIVYAPSSSQVVQDGNTTYILNEDGTADLAKYRGKAASVTIPESFRGYTVTGVRDYAFEYCKNLMQVVIPPTVKSIGGNVFYRSGEKRVYDAETTKMWRDAQNDPWARKEYGLYDPIPDYYRTDYTTQAVVKRGSAAERLCREQGVPYTMK